MPSRKNKGGLIARVNFPLYSIQMLTNRHILVGGGGGSSKTGVANGFEIFELSHDGWNFIAEEVTRHETGPTVVMNCAALNDGKKCWIVAGQESHCQLYNVVPKVVILENGQVLKGTGASTINKENLRQRKRIENLSKDKFNNDFNKNLNDNNNKDHLMYNKKLQFLLKPSTSIQTDFSESEALQRVVRISSNGKLLATGGMDGIVRLWKFPQLTKLHDLKGHNKEIDDIDFNSKCNLLATISKDGRSFIWDVNGGKISYELIWNPANGDKYVYKRLRFRIPNDKKSDNQLFMLNNAVISRNPSYLQLWNIINNSIMKTVAYKETLSAMAVSDDGKFVSVGTMFSGSVDIYIAFSLQRILHIPGAHSMFLTGLEFIPTKLDGPAITSNAETAVVSISVDNRICIHSIPFRHTLPFWLVILCIILSLCCAFMFCSYIDV